MRYRRPLHRGRQRLKQSPVKQRPCFTGLVQRCRLETRTRNHIHGCHQPALALHTSCSFHPDVTSQCCTNCHWNDSGEPATQVQAVTILCTPSTDNVQAVHCTCTDIVQAVHCTHSDIVQAVHCTQAINQTQSAWYCTPLATPKHSRMRHKKSSQVRSVINSG